MVTGRRIGQGLSLLFALVCGITTAVRAGAAAGLIVFLLALVPVAVIWWADDIGGYTGPCGNGSIDTPTPGCLIRVIGWAMLLSLGALLWRTLRH